MLASSPSPPAPSSAPVMYHLACSVQPCGLAPEDSIHAAVSAAAGQQCFWWIQENRPKNSGILKVRIDAACFGASGSSSSISSVFSIRSPPGCTLRDVTAAIALKAAAQGYVPLAAADSSIIVCACLPHPRTMGCAWVGMLRCASGCLRRPFLPLLSSTRDWPSKMARTLTGTTRSGCRGAGASSRARG